MSDAFDPYDMYFYSVSVNVLAREAEDKEIQMQVMEKWAKGKLKLKANKDKIYPISQNENITDKTDSSKTESNGSKHCSFFHIPEAYMQNKGLFLDVICRGAFPLAFLIFNIVFWCIYS